MRRQLFLLIAFLFGFCESELNITSTPTLIKGPDKTLKVICSFSMARQPDMVRLEMLTLYRQRPEEVGFTKLVSANSVLPNHVEEFPGFNGGASGWIHSDRNNDEDSYIRVEFIQPSSKEAGEYKCQSVGVNHSGDPINDERSLVVLAVDEKTENWEKRIKELESKLNETEERTESLKIHEIELQSKLDEAEKVSNESAEIVNKLENRLKEAEQRAADSDALENDLEIKLKEADSKVENLESRVNDSKQKLSETQKKAILCQGTSSHLLEAYRDLTERYVKYNPQSLYGISKLFDSSSYYVVIQAYIPVNQAITICTYLRGYLAEINTKDEFLFIENWLHSLKVNGFTPFSSLLTGAFYPSIGAPFDFSTHPGDPIFLGNWAPNEPHLEGGDKNWLLLIIDPSKRGRFSLADGVKDHFGQATLCEVSDWAF